MALAMLPGFQPTLRAGQASQVLGEVPKLFWKTDGADAQSQLFDATMRYSDAIPSRGATQLAIGVNVDFTGIGATAQTVCLRIAGIGDDDAGAQFVESSIVSSSVTAIQQWTVVRDEFIFFQNVDLESSYICIPIAWHSFKIGVRSFAAPTAHQVVAVTIERLAAAASAQPLS